MLRKIMLKEGMKVLATTFVLLSVFSTSALAYATTRYAFNDKGFSDPHNIYYKYYQYGSVDYSSYVDSAANAWTNSPAPVHLSKTSTYNSANIVLSSNLWGNTGWDAETYTLATDKYQININESAKSGFSGHESELVSHEMGHAHGLADVDVTFNNLMRYTGYKGSPTPTQDEVDGLIEKYVQ